MRGKWFNPWAARGPRLHSRRDALEQSGQILWVTVQRQMRQRVWKAANVRLPSVTLDTDTTVHTLYGRQMGARKSYNPKNKGKKSYQPILTFIAETREYVGGELRNGDRPTGKQIARHLESVFAALPISVTTISARVDSGFYCWEAVEAYQKRGCRFIMVARKTSRLVEELKAADWKRSPRTDADGQCEFRYQPEGWGQAYRFIALRYEKKPTTMLGWPRILRGDGPRTAFIFRSRCWPITSIVG